MRDSLFIKDIEWESLSGKQDLNKDSIHVFVMSVDKKYEEIKNEYQPILSFEEYDKASRYVNKIDTKRYIVSKYCSKLILSRFIDKPASDISFHSSGNKKPAINGTEFNISHSGNYILIAVSTSAVGIDVEHINKKFDFRSIIPECFSPEEAFFLNKNKETELLNFYGLWTRKEALLKATGEGLTDLLNQIDCLEDIIYRNQVKYYLSSFTMTEDYVMSLASSAKTEINFWRY